MAVSPELRAQLLALPAEDRQALAEELYESLHEKPVDPEWESAWTDEIAKRMKEIEDGTAELIDADVVFAEIRADLAERRRKRG